MAIQRRFRLQFYKEALGYYTHSSSAIMPNLRIVLMAIVESTRLVCRATAWRYRRENFKVLFPEFNKFSINKIISLSHTKDSHIFRLIYISFLALAIEKLEYIERKEEITNNKRSKRLTKEKKTK